MTRKHHPINKAERLQIKEKKDLDKKSKLDRANLIQRILEREAREKKEILNALRRREIFEGDEPV